MCILCNQDVFISLIASKQLCWKQHNSFSYTCLPCATKICASESVMCETKICASESVTHVYLVQPRYICASSCVQVQAVVLEAALKSAPPPTPGRRTQPQNQVWRWSCLFACVLCSLSRSDPFLGGSTRCVGF
jgi:hypothetical protein